MRAGGKNYLRRLGIFSSKRVSTGRGGWWGSWEEVCRIRFGLYNICNGRNGGPELALQGMSQDNVDIGLFQETKVTGGIYTRYLVGYRVAVTVAPRLYHGAIAIFYCEADHFTLEALRLHGPNVVIFQLVSEEKWWYLVSCYIVLDYAFTIKGVVADIIQRPRGEYMLVARDCNACLAAPEGNAHDKDRGSIPAKVGFWVGLRNFSYVPTPTKLTNAISKTQLSGPKKGVFLPKIPRQCPFFVFCVF